MSVIVMIDWSLLFLLVVGVVQTPPHLLGISVKSLGNIHLILLSSEYSLKISS